MLVTQHVLNRRISFAHIVPTATPTTRQRCSGSSTLLCLNSFPLLPRNAPSGRISQSDSCSTGNSMLDAQALDLPGKAASSDVRAEACALLLPVLREGCCGSKTPEGSGCRFCW